MSHIDLSLGTGTPGVLGRFIIRIWNHQLAKWNLISLLFSSTSSCPLSLLLARFASNTLASIHEKVRSVPGELVCFSHLSDLGRKHDASLGCAPSLSHKDKLFWSKQNITRRRRPWDAPGCAELMLISTEWKRTCTRGVCVCWVHSAWVGSANRCISMLLDRPPVNLYRGACRLLIVSIKFDRFSHNELCWLAREWCGCQWRYCAYASLFERRLAPGMRGGTYREGEIQINTDIPMLVLAITGSLIYLADQAQSADGTGEKKPSNRSPRTFSMPQGR